MQVWNGAPLVSLQLLRKQQGSERKRMDGVKGEEEKIPRASQRMEEAPAVCVQ